jgi:hypothetical protein
MAIRHSILTALCFAAAAVGPVAAQNNRVDLYGGYVYTKANPDPPLAKENMSGWVGSVTGFPNSWFGVGGEISAVFGDLSSATGGPAPHAKEYSYLFGPEFRFLDGARVQSAAKILLGGVFGQINLASATTPAQQQALLAEGYQGFNQTKFAMLLAVPVDVSVNRLLAIRFEPGLYLTGFNQATQSNFRFSVGPVFRFGGGR